MSTADLIYFSPTATTRKIIEEIAKGFGAVSPGHVNLTPLESKQGTLPAIRGEVAFIGMPVYAGRLPSEAVSRFKRINGMGIPAVIVVVYGNRAFDDALIELRDIAMEAGFRPIAAGAFIGEHSFSTDEVKLSYHRPDPDDLRQAAQFGKLIGQKMGGIPSVTDIPVLNVPGNHPYLETRLPKDAAPVSQSFCTCCQTCATVCPTGAISLKDNTMTTDASLCILCSACVKSCTTGARMLLDERIQKLRGMLATTFSQRKDPETFF